MTRGELRGHNERFADDDGSADPAIRRHLAAATTGQSEHYLAAVAALCGARLLVPVLAAGDETLRPDPAREGEVSAVLLQRPDGARALPVFTGTDSASSWHPRARPIPATLDRVAQTALAENAGTVLVDIAGPAPLTIEGEVLSKLAAGNRLVRIDAGFGWVRTATVAER